MNFTKTIFVLFISLILIGCQSKPSYSSHSESILKGNNLFQQHCTACHNFKSSGIGPNLSGITSVVTYDWLNEFIKNPKKLIESGDERSVALFKKHNIYMPSFEHLKDIDIDNILAFLNTKKELPTEAKNNYGAPLKDPIKDSILKNGKTLIIKKILQIPKTSENKPLARINKMFPTPNGKHTFISDLNGVLYKIENDHTVKPILKIDDYLKDFISKPGLGTGLGSFAFHPDFEINGLLYTTHTEDNKSKKTDFSYQDSIPKKLQWVLTEWEMTPEDFKIQKTPKELMRIDMVTGVHGVQEIAFNATATKDSLDYGNLYISVGDGGSAENKYIQLTQNTSRIWGTILRINPLGNNSKNKKYGIPIDNPFTNNPNAVHEIWAYGFRNPHRISWNPVNGDMLVSDIGHKKIEEVNLIKKGMNYGWPKREGTFAMYTNTNMENVYPVTNIDSTLIEPILQFDHDQANAICGGFVYNGNAIPDLKGHYLFGSIVRGHILTANANDFKFGKQANISQFDLSINTKKTTLKELTKHHRVDLRLGIDGSGELYIFTKADGKVYKIIGVQ